MENVVDLNARRESAEKALFDRIVDEQTRDEEFIEEFTQYLLFSLAEAAWNNGFDPTVNPTAIRDLMLIGESVKGLFKRTKGVHHPTHDVADTLFVFKSDHDEMVKFVEAMQEDHYDAFDEDDFDDD